MTEFLHSLATPQVRDLAQSCLGPDLICAEKMCGVNLYSPENDLANCAAWLRKLDRDPDPLFKHLAKRKSTRLGLYFESLWAFFWQRTTQTEVLAYNLQISKSGRTLGALDFIVKQGTRQIHIEAAVKFYLLSGSDENNYDQWIGPNTNDNLGKKIGRMQEHQFPILGHEITQNRLRQLNIDNANTEQALILKGMLFFPFDHIKPISDRLIRHKQNVWLHVANLDKVCAAEFYSVIPRNRWLGPAIYHARLQPLSAQQLKIALASQIRYDNRPRMVAELFRDFDGKWKEKKRFFVVSDYWPDTERPSRNT
ncbi:DUF1853 family protein [Gilvimarinus sp. SDUM040013]|uniref:DUF1853 family protein n=1 Tax=Gilvimarinus gilvus TaxID=3058038 RepID=A0ABU4S2N3_9GAMM|nr:DUF1853 family protein [Gilvimarinus sp. SDUM040013]MDO3385555.1 DUF1853 family protein [Gilvimarinus sp. SDUM040013]MDX6851194.1 DUF1853 family protein [Gilvimarinus sp. SDUM040013]